MYSYLTITKLADLMGLPAKIITDAIDSGALTARSVEGHTVVSDAAVSAWLLTYPVAKRAPAAA